MICHVLLMALSSHQMGYLDQVRVAQHRKITSRDSGTVVQGWIRVCRMRGENCRVVGKKQTVLMEVKVEYHLERSER